MSLPSLSVSFPSQTTSVEAEFAGVKPRRGRNYTVDGDVAVTRAYIHVTGDAMMGSEQKEGSFYMRIWEVYKIKKAMSAVERPLESVQTRVKLILKECVYFASCRKSVTGMKKSRCSEEDELRLATALFNKKQIFHSREDVGETFRFLKCWVLARDLPKFQAATSPSVSETSEGNQGNDEEDAGVDEKKPLMPKNKRPDGPRKAKEDLATQHVTEKKLKLAETAVKSQEQQAAEITRRNEIIVVQRSNVHKGALHPCLPYACC